MDKPYVQLAPCPKCGSNQTKVIGTSHQPVLTYLRCASCGHVFVPQVSRS
jgi:uncharacterized Zn finger protein